MIATATRYKISDLTATDTSIYGKCASTGSEWTISINRITEDMMPIEYEILDIIESKRKSMIAGWNNPVKIPLRKCHKPKYIQKVIRNKLLRKIRID